MFYRATQIWAKDHGWLVIVPDLFASLSAQEYAVYCLKWVKECFFMSLIPFTFGLFH
jgi:hypothetical protein